MSDKPSKDVRESLTAPGKLLRDQREKLGLTQTEVAARLRLSKQSIKDIEADDYSHFSAAIYVRGYIRSYAHVVKLDEQPLLRAFNEMGFVDQLNQLPRTSYIASSVTKTAYLNRSRRQLAQWVSYGFIALLIALVALWWHGQSNHKHADISAKLLSAVDESTAVDQSQPAPLPTTVKTVTTTPSVDDTQHQ